ncbi:hypothetical protein QT711_11725 [Sporosarcina saromensis]|uniref:Uncharacterized protein n=1 Tax=Sporosarcina saromensis TaxID=359365 RepID=A0ABU4GC15_9BACL|nr:hypothetical protein [Sporosarcina saromensis]MDW0113858.1 hypothetical protein [Sporosarcina saromensis]
MFLTKAPSIDDSSFRKYRPVPPVGIYNIGSKDANTLKKLKNQDELTFEELAALDLELSVQETISKIQEKVISTEVGQLVEESNKHKDGVYE